MENGQVRSSNGNFGWCYVANLKRLCTSAILHHPVYGWDVHHYLQLIAVHAVRGWAHSMSGDPAEKRKRDGITGCWENRKYRPPSPRVFSSYIIFAGVH